MSPNTHEFESFPPISEELIKALDEHYPDFCPMHENIYQIYHLQGQISVVRLLKAVRKAQNESILTKE